MEVSKVLALTSTTILYESPFRIIETLELIEEISLIEIYVLISNYMKNIYMEQPLTASFLKLLERRQILIIISRMKIAL